MIAGPRASVIMTSEWASDVHWMMSSINVKLLMPSSCVHVAAILFAEIANQLPALCHRAFLFTGEYIGSARFKFICRA